MQIKRFEAKDMTEALRQIKRELGPEAVILAARDLRRTSPLLGISRKVGVEVTAAADAHTLGAGGPAGDRRPAAAVLRTDSPKPEFPRLPLAARVQDIVRLGRRTAPPAPAPEIPAPVPGAAQSAVAHVMARLKAQGLRGHLLEQLGGAVAEAAGEAGGKPAADLVAAATRCLTQLGLTTEAWRPGGGRGRLLGVVGSPGVGKTTALMKLAVHFQGRLGLQTAVATLDTFGLGAAAAWQVFGSIAGVRVAAVETGEGLKRLLDGWRGCDVVLIDTPGIGAADDGRLAWVASQFEGLRHLELHMALAADRKEEDLYRVHHRLRRLPLQRVLVTRLDETLALGDLLHHLINVRLPLSYISAGQQIPQDFAEATLEPLVRRLLDAAPASAAVSPPETSASPAAPAAAGGRLLANRSSDIFHTPACRWTAMISPANLVEFATFDEALAKRFKPCRYCHPQHASHERWVDEDPRRSAACGS
jgi:flagellar biosynthesis protein FlhF